MKHTTIACDLYPFQALRDFVDCQNTLALGLGLGGEEGEGMEGREGRSDVLRTKLKLSKVRVTHRLVVGC